MVKIRRIERVAYNRKRAARRMGESVSTFPRRARRNSTALGKSGGAAGISTGAPAKRQRTLHQRLAALASLRSPREVIFWLCSYRGGAAGPTGGAVLAAQPCPLARR